MKPRFRCTITQSGLQIENREMFREYCSTIIGKEKYLVLQDKQEIRSLQQNKYFHGVVCKHVMNESSQFSSIDHVKDYLKVSVGAYRELDVVVNGEPVYELERTSKMSKKRFNEFMEKIKIFCWDTMEISIPEPDDVSFDENYYGF